jgi:hypothetical protein
VDSELAKATARRLRREQFPRSDQRENTKQGDRKKSSSSNPKTRNKQNAQSGFETGLQKAHQVQET